MLLEKEKDIYENKLNNLISDSNKMNQEILLTKEELCNKEELIKEITLEIKQSGKNIKYLKQNIKKL